ncbi:hypothetical protein Trydic_g13759 [Trypoxylus dichotomus]
MGCMRAIPLAKLCRATGFSSARSQKEAHELNERFKQTSDNCTDPFARTTCELPSTGGPSWWYFLQFRDLEDIQQHQGERFPSEAQPDLMGPCITKWRHVRLCSNTEHETSPVRQ